jgi:prepilin-type N-terminal cleavage/methylation domain-containing protein
MKKIFKKFRSAGFSLIEIVIAVSIFSVLIFVAANLLVSVMRNPKLQLATLDNIDQARMVASNFANEMRSAAYGTYPLVEAGDFQVIFYSTVGATQGNVNKIKYYTENNILYKGVTAPVDGIYDPESEVVKSVLSGLANDANPLFYYYNGEYDANGTGEHLVQPVNINSVKFVEINLQVQKKDLAPATFLVKAGATIRILKDNLSQ